MNDLDKIKKDYGENFMHLVRELFPTILEITGLLYKLIDSNFEHSRFLYDDIVNNNMKDEFKDFIYSLVNEDSNLVATQKNPFELMKQVGYTLYECKTEGDIQEFKKYYYDGEKLCTFRGNRLDTNYVFFAVKDNANEIKRENFDHPEREDEYGRSVISIQFTKGKANTLSIKNRYNHTVYNCDATFSNNLENIIEGLTDSFFKYYGFHINQSKGKGFNLNNYVRANDGKYYKYNYEINNVYYCPNNLIIDNYELVKDYQEKEKYLVFDYFIIDLRNENKSIYFYDKNIEDSFIKIVGEINKILILKDKEKEHKKLIINTEDNKEIIIILDKTNKMISYTNNNLLKLDDNFLIHNKELQELNVSNVLKIGNNVLRQNKKLKKLYLPFNRSIGNNCFVMNKELDNIFIPLTESIGNRFLNINNKLKEINADSLLFVGDSFLQKNECLVKGNFPKLTKIGHYFCDKIKDESILYIPNLTDYKLGFKR